MLGMEDDTAPVCGTLFVVIGILILMLAGIGVAILVSLIAFEYGTATGWAVTAFMLGWIGVFVYRTRGRRG